LGRDPEIRHTRDGGPVAKRRRQLSSSTSFAPSCRWSRNRGVLTNGYRRRMPVLRIRIRAACWTDEAPECPGSAYRPCARLDGPCAARAQMRGCQKRNDQDDNRGCENVSASTLVTIDTATRTALHDWVQTPSTHGHWPNDRDVARCPAAEARAI